MHSPYFLEISFALILLIKCSVQYSNSDCGILRTDSVTDSDNGKIVGGYDVGYYKYPWFVGLQPKYGKIFICGGTLITRQHVLSAAHCFVPNYQPPEQIYDYYLGVSNACERNKQKDRIKVYTSKSVNIHEKYHPDSGEYDIALITLNQKAHDFTPICLPFQVSLPRASPEGIIIGYGLKVPDEISSLACDLQEARVLIYSANTCKSVLESHQFNQNGENLVCAGYLKGAVDTCQGDSGGPLQVMGLNNRMLLRGITSFGWGCAEADSLGFYTDVSKYMDWIVSKVNGRKVPQSPTNNYNNYYQYLLWYNSYISPYL